MNSGRLMLIAVETRCPSIKMIKAIQSIHQMRRPSDEKPEMATSGSGITCGFGLGVLADNLSFCDGFEEIGLEKMMK
jgi:hypothetical protein